MTDRSQDLSDFVNPNPGDTLATSNGKASSEYLADLNDTVEGIRRQTIGAFANPKGFVDLAAVSLATGESLTADPPTNGVWAENSAGTIGLSHVRKTGASAVIAPGVRSANQSFYVNLPSNQALTGHNAVAMDVAFGGTFTTASTRAKGFYATVGTGVNLTGSVDSAQLPALSNSSVLSTGNLFYWVSPTEIMYHGSNGSGLNHITGITEGTVFLTNYTVTRINPDSMWITVTSSGAVFTLTPSVFHTVVVPLVNCTSVRSVGIAAPATGGDLAAFIVDNVRLASISGLDYATDASATVFVPADYASGVEQFSHPLDATQSMVDLRPDSTFISNLDGVKHLHQFGFHFTEDATIDVTSEMQAVVDLLQPGDTLMFPKGKAYLISEALQWGGKHDLTIDFNESALVGFGGDMEFMHVNTCDNITFKNFAFYGPHESTNAALRINNGTTTVVTGDRTSPEGRAACVMSLVSEGDAVTCGGPPQSTDWHGNYPMEITASSSVAMSGNPLVIEMIDSYSPECYDVDTTAHLFTAVPTGTTGAIPPGQTLYYWYADIDHLGRVSGPSLPVKVVTTTYCKVVLTLPRWLVYARHTTGNVLSRRLYRSENPVDPFDQTTSPAFEEIYETVTTYTDNQPLQAVSSPVFPETDFTTAVADGGTGGLIPAGTYRYFVTTVASTGQEHSFKKSSPIKTVTIGANHKINVTLPGTGNVAVSRRRVYRAGGNWPMGTDNDSRNLRLVADIADNSTAVYVDNIPSLETVTDRIPSVDAPDAGDSNPDWQVIAIPSLTTTPTAYHVDFTPGPTAYHTHVTFRVRKSTAAAGTITVKNMRLWGVGGSLGEGGHGFTVSNASNILIQDGVCEGVSADGISVRNGANHIVARRVMSHAVGRQGMSMVGGHDFLMEDCILSQSGRSGFDFEPGSANSESQRLVIRGCRIYNSGLNALELHWAPFTVIERCYADGPAGGGWLQGISGGGQRLQIINVDMPRQDIQIQGSDIVVDGANCESLIVEPDSDTGSGTSMVRSVGARATIQNVRTRTIPTITIKDAVVSNVVVTDIPEGSNSDPVFLNYDPGNARLTGAAKGPVTANFWYPRGLDVLDEPVRRVRGLSSSSVDANNFHGTSAVTAAATSLAVTFPTHAVTTMGWGQGNLTQSTTTEGTLVPGTTYFWRAAGRPNLGGPGTATSEITATMTGTNNTMRLKVQAASTLIYPPGITLWRGTTTNVYTSRFDYLPNADVYQIAKFAEGTQRTHFFGDMGAYVDPVRFQPNLTSGDVGGYGYPTTVLPTSTALGAPSWDGTKWVVANETGLEIDANYSVFVTTSWQTTYIVAKTRSGFTITFGVACPTGGGTLDWIVVR